MQSLESRRRSVAALGSSKGNKQAVSSPINELIMLKDLYLKKLSLGNQINEYSVPQSSP